MSARLGTPPSWHCSGRSATKHQHILIPESHPDIRPRRRRASGGKKTSHMIFGLPYLILVQQNPERRISWIGKQLGMGSGNLPVITAPVRASSRMIQSDAPPSARPPAGSSTCPVYERTQPARHPPSTRPHWTRLPESATGALYRLRDADEIVRLGGGLYRWATAPPADDDLVEIAERVPRASVKTRTRTRTRRPFT
jgi:hypothetical protein